MKTEWIDFFKWGVEKVLDNKWFLVIVLLVLLWLFKIITWEQITGIGDKVAEWAGALKDT